MSEQITCACNYVRNLCGFRSEYFSMVIKLKATVPIKLFHYVVVATFHTKEAMVFCHIVSI